MFKANKGDIEKELEIISRELDKKPTGTAGRDLAAKARLAINRYMMSPVRVAAIIKKFYDRAMENDKVLIEYVHMLVPRDQVNAPVTVIVNAPQITNRTEKVYDISGNEVKDE